MTLSPKAINTLEHVTKALKGKYTTYDGIPEEERAALVSSIMFHYSMFDPFAVYEKDGEYDLVLKAMTDVVATRGMDEKINQLLVKAVVTLFLAGTSLQKAAFSEEITAALQGTIKEDSDTSGSKD